MNLHTSVPHQFSCKEIYSMRAQEVQPSSSSSLSHCGMMFWRAAKSSCANSWEKQGLREAELQQCFAQFSSVTKDKPSKVQGHEPIGPGGQHVLGPEQNDNKVQLGLKFNTQNEGNMVLNKNNWQSYTFPPSPLSCHVLAASAPSCFAHKGSQLFVLLCRGIFCSSD